MPQTQRPAVTDQQLWEMNMEKRIGIMEQRAAELAKLYPGLMTVEQQRDLLLMAFQAMLDADMTAQEGLEATMKARAVIERVKSA